MTFLLTLALLARAVPSYPVRFALAELHAEGEE